MHRIRHIAWFELRIALQEPRALVTFAISPLIIILLMTNPLRYWFESGISAVRAPVAIAGAPQAWRMEVADTLRAHGLVVREAEEMPKPLDGLAAVVEVRPRGLRVLENPENPAAARVVRELLLTRANPGFDIRIEPQPQAARANAYSFTVPGITLTFSFYILSTVAGTFFREKDNQTWRRLLTSPASLFEILTGKMLMGAVIVAVQFAVTFAVGVLFLGMSLGPHPLAVMLVVLLWALMAACFGLLVTSLSASFFGAAALTNLVTILFGSLSGALFPLAAFPGWLEWLARATPLYWENEALKGLMVSGRPLAEILLEVGAVLLFGLVAFALGLLRFRRDKFNPAV